MIRENKWRPDGPIMRTVFGPLIEGGGTPSDLAKNADMIVKTLAEVGGDTSLTRLLERYAGVQLGYIPLEISLEDLVIRALELGYFCEDNGPIYGTVEHTFRLVRRDDEEYVSNFSVYQIEGSLWVVNFSWERFVNTFVGIGPDLSKRRDRPNYINLKEKKNENN